MTQATKTKKRGNAQRLPPGCKEDGDGYYLMMPAKAGTEKRVEVIFETDTQKGRAIANQRDAIYWDHILKIYLIRGLKLLGGGPRPPVPEGLYTTRWYAKRKPRRLGLGNLGTGRATDLTGAEQKEYEPQGPPVDFVADEEDTSEGEE